MSEDKEWLEKLPVMSYAVNIFKFEELMNYLYNYTRRKYERAVENSLLLKILYSFGYITSERYIDAEVTEPGKKYFEKIDGQIYVNEPGQNFLKDYLLTNGFVAPECDSKPKILSLIHISEPTRH